MIRTFSALSLVIFCISCNAPAQDEASTQVTEDQKTAETDTVTAESSEKMDYVKIDSEEALIATALMAAPAESRQGAKVIGYNMEGEFVTLKEGDNQFICLADDPSKKGFSAACYHKDLEPFMARGRQLRAEGKKHQEIFDIREEEVKSKKLLMAKSGATLHIYASEDALYDPDTKEVKGANYRYVVYMPYATAESTGLPESPIAPNHPWIMNPGTHRAHIMITPKAGE